MTLKELEIGKSAVVTAVGAEEGDHLILTRLKLDRNERETFEHIVLQMETERGLDRSARQRHDPRVGLRHGVPTTKRRRQRRPLTADARIAYMAIRH